MKDSQPEGDTDARLIMNTLACDRCRHRKSRCDRILPKCGPYTKAGAVCKYIDRTKDRRETIEGLQRRVRLLEATNADLNARLAQSSPEIPRSQVDDSGLGHLSDPGPAGRIGLESRQDESGRSDEVIEEVSFLSRQAGGEHPFLGSASGIPFARLVSTTIGATSPGHSREAFGDARAPGQASIRPGLPVETSVFPPQQVARDLHRAYFDHDHLSYPFLHRPTVLTALDRAYKDPSFLEQDASSSFVFDMILAIATANVNKFDLESLPNAEGYYLRAAHRLDEVFRNGGTQALQAILLMGQYRMKNSTQDTSNSMWHIVGIAARMCFELGLHREQMYRYHGMADEAESVSVQTRNEIRRRCFWCVVAMDRVVSIALGRPLAIHLQDADVALPNLSLDDASHCTSDTDQPPASRYSRTAIFVHIVRYRVICGDILSTIHNGSARLHMEEISAHAARNKLASELASWHTDTENLSLPAVDLSTAIAADRSSYCTREWYELLYHNALLMLYRPSPALSLDSPRDAAVLQTVFVAAKQAITLYAHLHRSRRINYTWITLHSVFMAGLSYLYAVSRHFRSRRRHNFPSSSLVLLESDPTIIEIVNDSRRCSNVLVAISERWNLAKNCHDIFNRLSDAMLSDVVEHHTKAPDSVGNTALGSSEDSRSTPAGATSIPLHGWAMDESGLAIDSMLHECFVDLQRFQPYGCGNDPVSQFSHDWLGEIGETGLNLHSVW